MEYTGYTDLELAAELAYPIQLRIVDDEWVSEDDRCVLQEITRREHERERASAALVGECTGRGVSKCQRARWER